MDIYIVVVERDGEVTDVIPTTNENEARKMAQSFNDLEVDLYVQVWERTI